MPRYPKHLSKQEQFELHFVRGNDDECWEWTNHITEYGYGQFFIDGKSKRAHRVAYEMYVGPIPNGLIIRHKCNNTKCVNPNHLIPGTRQDNMDDKVKANRQSHTYGEQTNNNVLTEKQVLEIRDQFDNHYHKGIIVKLAKQYNVDNVTISRVTRRISWAHLP